MARATKAAKAAPLTPHKRKAPAPTGFSGRSSKRLRASTNSAQGSAQQKSPKKSIYFEGSDSDSDGGVSSSSGEASGYEDEDASVTSPTEDEEEEEDSEKTEDEKPTRKRSRTRSKLGKKVQSLAKSKSGNADPVVATVSAMDLLKEGVRTGLEPGVEVAVKLVTARDDGGIPYTPSSIHPNTMLFLSELKQNNDREWLKSHDPIFRQAEQDWKSFLENLIERVPEVDPTIPELPVKDIIYRIYRDVRFSPDKTPYKTNFSAYFSRTGRKGPYAGYYLQIAPRGHSLIAGGVWCPEAPKLRLIRRNIDRHPEQIKNTLLTPEMREHVWDEKIKAGDTKTVVKTFTNLDVNMEYKLKKGPADYHMDHPEIELLKLKSFIAMKKIPDVDVVGMGSVELMDRILQLIGAFRPFVEHINRLIMPDTGQTPSESEDDENEDGSEEGIEEAV